MTVSIAPVAAKMGGFVKNPIVLAVGVALGVGLLVMASRNSGGNQAGDTTASQAIASRTNVELGAQATDYNKAALGYMGTLANNAELTKRANINAQAAIVMHSLENFDNIIAANSNQALQRQSIAGGIAINSANNKALLDNARLNAETKITLAPQAAALAESLARIQGSNAVMLATINADAARSISSINAAARMQGMDRQADSNDMAGIMKIGGALIGGYFGGPAGATAGAAVGGAIAGESGGGSQGGDLISV